MNRKEQEANTRASRRVAVFGIVAGGLSLAVLILAFQIDYIRQQSLFLEDLYLWAAQMAPIVGTVVLLRRYWVRVDRNYYGDDRERLLVGGVLFGAVLTVGVGLTIKSLTTVRFPLLTVAEMAVILAGCPLLLRQIWRHLINPFV